MGEAIDKVLSKVDGALSDAPPALSPRLRELAGPLADELLAMLSIKNGFYGFQSALHLFPTHAGGGVQSLESWNDPDTWIHTFKGAADGALFFGEDVFGFQFAIVDGVITSFEPETAEHEQIADSIEGWAQEIVNEFQEMTGWPFARDWEEQHGPIPPGTRLYGIQPFMAGGEFELENLRPIDSVKQMQFYGDFYNQTKDIPEGGQFTFLMTKESG